MGISYVQRTMRELRNQGRVCAIVEKFNPYVGQHGIRQDLFGIIDVLALDPERGVVGVQVCGQDWQPHIKKLIEERTQETWDWLATPGTVLELHGWRKVKKKRGGKQMIWKPRMGVFQINGGEIEFTEL
jgi:hypothetical protein